MALRRMANLHRVIKLHSITIYLFVLSMMQLIRVIIALGALAAPILAAPIDSKADVKPRWFDLSPSIASFGDEGPVEDADAGAADEAAQAKRRWFDLSPSIASFGDEGPVKDSETGEATPE
ncbi:hypothetical protein COL26b_002719 [Colletotrichum chrysophilum]|uniref:uncharacterized protein n=1 Tax=Colletotrichum chrysophilum TaxID=1836956 RepID=UPI0023003A8F|nr:uncharacterized protein COL26b_002719 [Colletotrichum chrysophilum]KAJ0378943.1 hypothetical protein COL26b_002719 [Colletotrichum chrysophilum]